MGAGGSDFNAGDAASKAAIQLFAQYASSILSKFGTGSRGLGRAAQRELIGLQRKAIAIAQSQVGAQLQANRFAVTQATGPGSGLFAVRFAPPALDRAVQVRQAKLDAAVTKLGRFQARHARNVGDRRSAQASVKKQERKLAKATEARDLSTTTVLASTYGINNPLVAGSRDDPLGAIRPDRASLLGFR